jgi:hypothetical protein
MSVASHAFIFFSKTDGTAYVLCTSSSYLLDSGRLVMSSNNTSSSSRHYCRPIVSLGLAGVLGLGFGIPFRVPKLYPTSPCGAIDFSTQPVSG